MTSGLLRATLTLLTGGVLAHALPLLARGTPISQVAAATGYASDSAFGAMFKTAMGQPPSHFMHKNEA